MNCSLSNHYIMKFFDGELGSEEKIQLNQHLEACTKCSMDFRNYSEAFKVLEYNTMVEPPENFESNVMKIVNTLEVIRRKRLDSFLIFLYGVMAVFFIVSSILLLTTLKHMNILTFFGRLGESVSILSHVIFFLNGIFKTLHNVAWGIMEALLLVTIIIVKTYYYILALLIGMLLLLQKMFMNILRHDGGGME